jgi:hypothetical protein
VGAQLGRLHADVGQHSGSTAVARHRAAAAGIQHPNRTSTRSAGCRRIRSASGIRGRCPRGPLSGADVGREVLARQRRPRRHQVGRCAFEHDPAAVVAGAGAEVDDPVGVCHDRLVVLDHDDRLA